MSGEDSLVSPGERACPNCGAERKSLAGHWARSSCPWPEIDDQLRATLDGFALAGASADGKSSTRLRIWTTNKELALWTHDQLDWLGKAVHIQETDHETQYRVVTESHPDLERYRRWGGRGVPPTDGTIVFSPALARAWFAHAGGLVHKTEYPGGVPSLRIAARTNEDRAEAIGEILSKSGFNPSVDSNGVQLSPTQCERLCRQLGDPIPGIVYKWCFHNDVYREARRRHEDGDLVISLDMDMADRFRSLLRLVAESLDLDQASLAEDVFWESIANPDPADISEWLGGGSWEDALSIAGIPSPKADQPQWKRSTAGISNPKTPDRDQTPPSPGEKYSYADGINAVKDCAGEVTEPISSEDYREWSKGRDDTPSYSLIEKRWGWGDITIDAEVETSQKARLRGEYTADHVMQAIIRIREDLGHWPSVTEYRNRFLAKEPSWWWLKENEPDGIAGFPEARERAKEEYGEE